jgi:hypothetical protein
MAVPIDSQDGSRRGKIISKTNIFLPTASRAEFIVKPPNPNVKKAELITLNINTGPVGDDDPTRSLAAIQTRTISALQSAQAPVSIPNVSGPPNPQRFEGLSQAKPTAARTLYFSENQPSGSSQGTDLLHHSRWSNSCGVRSEQSSRNYHYPGFR